MSSLRKSYQSIIDHENEKIIYHDLFFAAHDFDSGNLNTFIGRRVACLKTIAWQADLGTCTSLSIHQGSAAYNADEN